MRPLLSRCALLAGLLLLAAAARAREAPERVSPSSGRAAAQCDAAPDVGPASKQLGHDDDAEEAECQRLSPRPRTVVLERALPSTLDSLPLPQLTRLVHRLLLSPSSHPFTPRRGARAPPVAA